MDIDEGRRLGIEPPEPTRDVDIGEQVEPWGWHSKIMPRHIRRRLRLYREFLERLGDRGDQ